MPKFFNSNDLIFIKTISEEVVDYVVEQIVTLYKVSVGETKTNLYGESTGKIYHAPANLPCIVEREPKNVEYNGYGPDKTQAVEFRFMRHNLRNNDGISTPLVHKLDNTVLPADSVQNNNYGYPEIGDIIFFDGSYFEIDNVQENKLVGGSPRIYESGSNDIIDSDDARMELIAIAFMVRRSQIQIEERVV